MAKYEISKHGFLTTAETSATMRAIRDHDTKPELSFRHEVWRRGFRYVLNRRDLSGVPDLVFVKYRAVVFVDGDFWHGYNWANRKPRLSRNRDYWVKKIESNMARDIRVTRELSGKGWLVLRYWEHNILHRLDDCVNLTITILHRRDLHMRIQH